LTKAVAVKTLTALNASILLKCQVRGFGGASAFSVAVFASTVVGAGFAPVTGGTPLSPPPGEGGAPAFVEQLQRATEQAGSSDSVEASLSTVISASSQDVSATPPASVPLTIATHAKPGAQADWGDEFFPALSDIPVSSGKRTQPLASTGKELAANPVADPRTPTSGQNTDLRNLIPAQPPAYGNASALASQPSLALLQTGGPVTATLATQPDSAFHPSIGAVPFAARIKTGGVGGQPQSLRAPSATPTVYGDPALQGVKTTAGATTKQPAAINSGSVPVVTRGSNHRAAPGNQAPGTVADPHPPTGLPSDQNTDLRNLTPVQAPANISGPELAIQPSPALLTMDASLAAATPIRTEAASNPSIGDLAFAARIKPGGPAVQPQSQPASAANSTASGYPASQSVKATGEATAKDRDSSSDQRENSAPPAPSSVPSSAASSVSAAKSSFRKEEATDSSANVVEPNGTPLTQPIPQAVSTGVADEPRSAAPPQAQAAQNVAQPEPTHVLLDKPSQTTTPAKSISLQVEGASGQMVDIRIASRSGDLDVAVRAGDDNVAQNLRQGLGDLESRLAQNGYHAETWHPGHSGSSTEPAAPASNSSNSSSQQQSQSGPGSQQNRGQRDNNPSNRPRWVNELASSLKTQSTEKGNANGINT
jgi:hypothetical protein